VSAARSRAGSRCPGTSRTARLARRAASRGCARGASPDGPDIYNDAITTERDRLAEAMEAQTRATEVLIGLEREMVENQNKILAVATSQPNVIIAGLLDMVNGGLGGKTGLGFETPSFAGGLSRY
jgi:hypothetical protein